eukprot:CAMPEP_0206540672 /NCGR_PEP_ID=MMETSP0325_2-20121206/9143_1 /ASSEMBLY_ACC=CAM_ASM_000347 /TAXON_ID=2866 /ORGANISM="Crypthecodinium cohnii, Strain Seligo" /LENGTH=140 /DNA_ID=CAMNT_0054038437 /DNA_START=332 /DNA_END=754 /DNA_ORIENTATION=-
MCRFQYAFTSLFDDIDILRATLATPSPQLPRQRPFAFAPPPSPQTPAMFLNQRSAKDGLRTFIANLDVASDKDAPVAAKLVSSFGTERPVRAWQKASEKWQQLCFKRLYSDPTHSLRSLRSRSKTAFSDIFVYPMGTELR